MAKKNYYAVRKGMRMGIFNSWDECRAQVDGYPGAEFKGFVTKEEACDYLGIPYEENGEVSSDTNGGAEHCLQIYVDGSYDAATNMFSYGMVVLQDGCERAFYEKIEDEELAAMHNVAGEIKGAEAAMRYAVDNNAEKLIIYHDYEGIAKWCTREWKAGKSGTQAYRDYYDSVKEKVQIQFIKVKGHSNNKYNEMADKLAKKALGLL